MTIFVSERVFTAARTFLIILGSRPRGNPDPAALARTISKMKLVFRNPVLGLAVCLWLAAVFVGVGWLWSYNNAAGAAARPPAHWPEASAIARGADRHTLVMLAHPKCPCTRASIEELSKLMTATRGRLSAFVIFVTPAKASSEWQQTDLRASAARIPGVTTIVDAGGREASSFGALTSGQVVLYDPQGQLIFHGGITSSRGHIGDNAGRNAIEALLLGQSSRTGNSQVFGCPIFDPSECPVPNNEQANK
jgi:hypothetical protein